MSLVDKAKAIARKRRKEEKEQRERSEKAYQASIRYQKRLYAKIKKKAMEFDGLKLKTYSGPQKTLRIRERDRKISFDIEIPNQKEWHDSICHIAVGSAGCQMGNRGCTLHGRIIDHQRSIGYYYSDPDEIDNMFAEITERVAKHL